ncbi:response regulator [Pelosinus sp. sgz500959]|uniref:response regulator n=1 Tax=Pelosinus sp. sgz500959 TaxID=3242472 RepID=UPI00366E9115
MGQILIVDDSTMVRKFYTYILTSFGYQIREAEDGYLALEMLLTDGAENFDLVITDINMPRMDGFEFIAEMRNTPGYETTPILIMTTQDHECDVQRGLSLGANLYFIKPAAPEKLVHCVRELLEGTAGKGL